MKYICPNSATFYSSVLLTASSPFIFCERKDMLKQTQCVYDFSREYDYFDACDVCVYA